jgi:predicted dehydrogenase
MAIRIGILGAAKVAVYALIAPAKTNPDVFVKAIAARDEKRAAEYAAAHGIPQHFDSYEALIAAPDIDAVYVALPPNVHAQWSIAALKAGKHVLCEKPFALKSVHVREMNAVAARTGKILMEAQHTYYHPFYIRIREILRSGMLGTIEQARAHFDVPIKDVPGELRFLPDIGGGALWDLGVYPAFWLRSIFGSEPKIISAVQRLAASGADLETSAEFEFDSKIPAQLSCAMDRTLSVGLEVIGGKGTVRGGWRDKPLHLILGGQTTQEVFDDRTSYDYQLDAFVAALKSGIAPPTSGTDSLNTILMLEAIVAAAQI